MRSEKLDQDIHSSEESAKSIDNELAADFMLLGEVNSIVQTSGKTQVRTYFVTIQLHDLETNRIVFSGENSEIKKVTQRKKRKL